MNRANSTLRPKGSARKSLSGLGIAWGKGKGCVFHLRIWLVHTRAGAGDVHDMGVCAQLIQCLQQLVSLTIQHSSS